MNKLVSINSQITMSSIDIADLVESRHADVCRTIERLSASGVIEGSPPSAYTHPQNGQTYKKYELCKRDSYVVVAQLSPQFTARLVDRWQELESATQKLPQTFAEALRLAADQAEQIALMAPKADVFDKIVDRNNLYNATQVAQKVGKSAVWLNRHLESMDVYNRSVKRGRAFQQWFVEKGYGIMRETETGHSQPMFYAEGEMWVIEKLTSEGII